MDLVYLSTQPEILERICAALTNEEIIELRNVLKIPELNCTLVINDVDQRINSLFPINDLTVQLYEDLKFEEFSSDNAFIEAIAKPAPRLYWEYLKLGANPEAVNKYSHTALLIAASNKQLELVKELLNRGVDINRSDQYGVTALMYAAENGYLDLVLELLNRGANVDAVENNGETALFFAIRQFKTEIAKELINRGINTRLIDNFGTTALGYARSHGANGIARLIEEKHRQ